MKISAVCAAVALVSAGFTVMTPGASAGSPASTLALNVLLIGGGSTDPTTAAWQATLTNEGVPFTLVTAAGTYGSETVTLPTLSSGTTGNFDGVVIADSPSAFATGQLTALDTYEAGFAVRQVDGYGYPSPTLGVAVASGGALDGTTATLTPAGLAQLPELKGPVPFATGTYGYPATVNAGAPFTPWLENSAGQVLAGVYQHPSTDAQANVSELELSFNYAATMSQWLLLGPGLIDWVTGGEHVGLYRNYFGEDVDDLFIADDGWDSALQCTPAATNPVDYNCPVADQGVPQATDPGNQMSAADVAYVANWEKQTGITLELAFNAIGACTAPQATEESTADCTGSVTDNGTVYTDPGQVVDSSYPNDSAFVDALLADQADFNWITHTWSHMYLGCSEFQPLPVNPAIVGSAGTLGAGGYSYEVTAATAYGESEPSTPQAVTVGANGSVSLSWADATNGGGPTLWQEEANHIGGTGFWGYYIYRENPGATTFGLIGSVPEDPTGATASYSFTDTGAVAVGGPTTINTDTGGATVGSGPTSTSDSPTATNPGIECAGTGGADWLPATSTIADSSVSQEIGLDQAFAAANKLTNYNPAILITGEHSGLENPNQPLAYQDTGITVTADDASRQPTQYAMAYPNGTGETLTDPRYPSNIYYNTSNWPDEINEYNTLYVAPGVSIGTYSGPESPTPVPEDGRCDSSAVTTCLTTPATEASILASETSIMMSHVLANDPRVGYAHQPNLMGPATQTVNGVTTDYGYTLLTLINAMLAQYDAWYNTTTTPLDQIVDASSSQLLTEQTAWASVQSTAPNQVTATQTGSTVTITNTGTTSVNVPVTVPTGSTVNGAAFGQAYGGSLSEWLTLAGGASESITVPSAVPAFTSAAAASFALNAAGSFSVTTTGTPDPSLTETGALPAGVTFVDNGNGTATLAGTPTTGGSFPITLTASNLAGTTTQSFVLTVPVAPTITSAASATSIVGIAGTFTVTTTGTPFPTITETGALPSGVTFVDNGNGTATLAGTPASGTGAAFPLTITATNTLGTATQSFTLTNAEAPTITSPAAATFAVGVAGTYTVTTTGYPAAAITESGTLPTGLTFTDNGNGTATLTGTDTGATGTYPVTITATNATAVATSTLGLAITVNAAAAPTITSGAVADFTFNAAGAVAITTTGSPIPVITETGTLPAGLTFVDEGTGTALISGTPTATGTTTLTITASNGVTPAATQTFTLVVGQAPAFTSATTTTGTVGSAFSFIATAGGYPAPSWGYSNLPPGVIFTDNLNGTATLSGTPTTTGSYAVPLLATNAYGSVSQTLTITIQAGATLNPSPAAAGQTVTITGSGFGATQGSGYVQVVDNGISWGAPGNAAAFATPTWSDGSISFTVPTPSGTGDVWAVTPGSTATVTVTNSSGVVTGPLNLTIAGTAATLSPNPAAAGQTVTITGSGFGATQGSGYVQVVDNGISWGAPGNAAAFATPTWSDGSISFTVPTPSGNGGVWAVTPGSTATVTVTNSSGVVTGPLNLTIAGTAATLSPNPAAAGQTVTITGSGFGTTRGSGYVTFLDDGISWGAPGNAAAFATPTWSDGSISFTVPTPSGNGGVWAVTPGSTATVTVTNSSGVVTGPLNLTIAGTAATLSPNPAAAGQTVTITGSGFGATQGSGYVQVVDNGISWGAPGNAAAFATPTWSDGSISFTVPTPSGNGGVWAVTPGSTATVTVTNSSGVVTGPLNLTIAGTAATLSPNPAAAGQTVTITGSGFGASQGSGYVQVVDNGISWGAPGNAAAFATPTWSDGSISFTVPTPSGNGGVWAVTPGSTATVTVTNSSGVVTGPLNLTIAGTAATLSPNPAAAGQTVTITGSGFGASQGSGYVHVLDDGISWGAPGNAAAFATPTWSDGSISFTVPTPSGNGDVWAVTPGSTATVTVTNSSGVVTGPLNLTIAGPVATSLNPTSAAAGQTVTITGSGFGTTQGSGYVTFLDDGISWGAPGNTATFAPLTWANGSITFTVPTQSGNSGEWMVTPGSTATVLVTTSAGTSQPLNLLITAAADPAIATTTTTSTTSTSTTTSTIAG